MTPPKKKNLHILMFSPTVRKLTTQSSYGEPTTGQPLYSFCFMNMELTTSFLKCVCTLNCVWLFATTWTIAPQAPLSVEFSRQEYWIGLPFKVSEYETIEETIQQWKGTNQNKWEKKKNHGGNKCKNKKMEIIKTNPPITNEIGRGL